jgi:hypothetical protein
MKAKSNCWCVRPSVHSPSSIWIPYISWYTENQQNVDRSTANSKSVHILVQWSDDLGWTVVSLIYSYVAVCRVCVVRCLVITSFSLLFSNYSTYVFLILFISLFPCFVCLFSLLRILRFCIVLCIFSTFVYSCLFPIFVQVYRPLPPGGNSSSVNKCHIIYHIVSYIVSYIIYHILSYHISYRISYIIYSGSVKCCDGWVAIFYGHVLRPPAECRKVHTCFLKILVS